MKLLYNIRFFSEGSCRASELTKYFFSKKAKQLRSLSRLKEIVLSAETRRSKERMVSLLVKKTMNNRELERKIKDYFADYFL